MRTSAPDRKELAAENILLKQRIKELEILAAERKRLEQAMWSSELKYQTIFETAGNTMVITEENMTISLVNNGFEGLTGFARQEVEGKKTWAEFVDPDDLNRMIAQHRLRRVDPQRAMKSYEFRMVHRDGSRKNIILTVALIPGTKKSVASLMDITDSKRAEEALRESREYTKILFDSSSIPKIVMDPDTGVFTDCNKAAVEMYGYASREEVLGKTPLDVSTPTQYDGSDSAAANQARIQTCRENGSHSFEWRHQRPDGQIWDAEVHLMLFWHKGKPLIQFTLHDITARRKAERALRRSEVLFRSLFNAAPVGLCIMKDRIFQNANNTWYEMIGYTEGETIGHSPRILYADEEEYRRVGGQLYGQGTTSVTTRLKRKNGEVRDVILTGAPLQQEDLSQGTIVAIEDITEHKQILEDLEENRRRLEDIIEFLPDATLVIDRKGHVIAWNRAIENMTGVKKKEILGRGNYEYALPFYGERRPILIDLALRPDREMEKRYTGLQKAGDNLLGEAFTPVLKSGKIHLSATASVLRNSRGEIIAAIECIRDNTERKRMEERLSRAEKMESLGTLAGGVAHDLNNVLGVLVGNSELLLEKIRENENLKRYASNIMQSSLRATAIIQDLLTLARRNVQVSEILDLNRAILNYLKSPEFEKLRSYHPGVKIKTDFEELLLNIKGSPIHLSKTIMNLVSNAVEAIPDRGEVALRTENRYLDYPVGGYDEIKAGDYVVLTVADTGAGISEDDLGKIFEPFYTKKVMGRSGTGLGLAVVWGTVKDHGGYIDVQSEPGKGTTFHLYFPVTRDEKAKSEKAISAESYMGQGESLLVVDDMKEQRELAVSMLERLGYRVVTATGGVEAVEFLKKNKADLVILDMIMEPGIDGLETYRRILEINPNQRAIIVSGFSETDRVRQAQQMGVGSFVRKPYILENIGTAIRRELDRK